VATIKKRTDGHYRARHRDDTGREHAQHFTRRVDAQRWLDEVTTAVLTGAYVDPRAGKVTVRTYAEQGRSGQVWRANTVRRTESSLGSISTPPSVTPTGVPAALRGPGVRQAPVDDAGPVLGEGSHGDTAGAV
jgi:hypothetical protein